MTTSRTPPHARGVVRSLDATILMALRAAPEGVSGADLADRLQVSRAAIWARIEELRRLGYEIEATPHRGYRLGRVPDVLHADDLLSRLGPVRAVGRDIRVFAETTSTNDVAEKLARDGVGEGVVVFGESQTRGRGRLGRTWSSPARKGLWFTVVLRPAWAPQAVTRLTIGTATAMARAVHSVCRVPVAVKWPNDLLVRGRKIGGILTEMSAELDRVRWVLVGVGLNVNQVEDDFPSDLRPLATSLRLATGRIQDRAALAAAALRELDQDYTRLVAGQFERVADEWESLCTTLGRPVSVVTGTRRVRGRAEALDADGALLVRTEHGTLERIVGGDVTLEK